MKVSIQRARGIVWMIGSVTHNAQHQHHAMQIVWTPPHEHAEVAWGSNQSRGTFFVIEGNTPHSLHMPRGAIALIESESALAAQFRTQWLHTTPVACTQETHSMPLIPGERLLYAPLLDVEDLPCSPSDFRIRRVLRWLDHCEQSGVWSGVDLEQALEISKLSRSRFLHLFTEQVGTPWRRYLLWRRVLIAAHFVFTGSSLTEAAHSAGYADSSHLSRQFRALFGYSPAASFRNSTFVQDEL